MTPDHINISSVLMASGIQSVLWVSGGDWTAHKMLKMSNKPVFSGKMVIANIVSWPENINDVVNNVFKYI